MPHMMTSVPINVVKELNLKEFLDRGS